MKKAFYRIFHAISKITMGLLKIRVPVLASGAGATKKLPEFIKSRGINNVLIVTDKVLMELGLLKGMFQALEENQIVFTVYDRVEPNPSIKTIENGLAFYNASRCEAIIAFGGGSPMDCAKMIGARAANPTKTVRKMRGFFKLRKKLPPFFAVPTTAGSGSETTVAAVVSAPETHEKFAVIDLKLVPDVAVLDPELMLGLPPHITSSTGMDALTHAVEAYIGLHGTAFTNENAEKAVRLIFKSLETVFEDGSHLEGRNSMALASFHGGVAFSRASLGYVHAIAHNMGGHYGIPHGLANAVILPYVLDLSRKDAEEKLAKLAVVGGIGEKGDDARVLSYRFIDKIREMNRNMGIPTSLKELKRKDIPLIAQRALKEANPMYPVPTLMNQQECEALIERMLP